MTNRFGIDDAQAPILLTKLSRSFNTTVSNIATDVVRGGPADRAVNRLSHH